MSNLPRTKSLALMFLLGAFLTGGAVGFVADRAVTLSRPAPRPQDERAMRDSVAREMRDSLARELHLSDAQRVKVDSIFDWRRARNRQIMDSVQPAFDATRDSARVLMLQSLDSAQQQGFKRIITRLAAADSARRRKERGR